MKAFFESFMSLSSSVSYGSVTLVGEPDVQWKVTRVYDERTKVEVGYQKKDDLPFFNNNQVRLLQIMFTECGKSSREIRAYHVRMTESFKVKQI